MLTHTLDMVLQITFFFLLSLGIHIFLVCHKRDLRVHYGILSLRIVKYHIWLHLLTGLIILQRTSKFISESGLHLIVDSLRQSLTCQQVTQDNLPHIATHLVIAT